MPVLAQSSKIEVADAWARPPIGQSRNTAAYLTLTNRGSAPDRLLGAATAVAGKAELHTTVRDGNVMRMREVNAIELKPGAAVTFAPGGMHLMLFDVQPLKAGGTFTLTLTFEKAGKQDVTVAVQSGPTQGGSTDRRIHTQLRAMTNRPETFDSVGDDVLGDAVGEVALLRIARSCCRTAARRSTACRAGAGVRPRDRRSLSRRDAVHAKTWIGRSMFLTLVLAAVVESDVELARARARRPRREIADPAGLGQRLRCRAATLTPSP